MIGKTHLGLAVLALAASISAAAQQPAAPPAPPPGPGLTLINERCSSCHNTSQLFGVHKPAPDWVTTVQSMIDRGAELDPGEQKIVVNYLAANFAAPAAGTPAPTPTATPHP